MIGDFLPIISAVLATIGTIAAGVFTTRRLARYGLSTEQLRVQTTLRELADVANQKVGLLETDIAGLKARLSLTQHDLDDAERQLDDCRAERRELVARLP